MNASWLSSLRRVIALYTSSQGERCQQIVDSVRFISSSVTMPSLRWTMLLVCPNGTHKPIRLEHKTPAFLGRNPDTRIVDPRCSRKQLELVADSEKGTVNVKQLGSNSSDLDGLEMIQGKTYTMKSKSLLHVLTGLYPQKLELIETQTKTKKEEGKNVSSSSTSGSKRPRETSIDSEQKSKKLKTDDKRSKSPKGMSVSEKQSPKQSADDAHVKEIEDKLKILKDSAKRLKKPPSVNDKRKSTEIETAISSSDGMVTMAMESKFTWSSEPGWQQKDTLYIYTPKDLENKRKIAGFDIDGTIILTKSGKTFATSATDWKLFCKEVPKRLEKLHNDGFKIVFFTNQRGVSRGKTKMTDLKKKFEDVLKLLKVPIQVYVATGGEQYRKPNIGMWECLCHMGNSDVPIDVSNSLYVGDAAGRQEKWIPKKKKDFSCSDRLFALNIGLKFLTPEEYFQGYPPCSKFNMPDFDPRKVSSKTPLLDPPSTKLTLPGQEVIILVGCPAVGKSTFAKEHLVPHGYVYINRDTLKTREKCVQECKKALESGKSAVIDNTNPDKESRARYLTVAKATGVPCRCFLFDFTLTQARHHEKFRQLTHSSHSPINEMVMNFFKKHYAAPLKSEGFSEIAKVNFVPKFNNSREERLYRLFLIEK